MKRDYKDLTVWQKAMDMVTEVYRFTRQFLGLAKGSLAEVDTQLLIARNLGYLSDPDPVLQRTAEVARLLNGLLNSLKVDS